MAEVPVVFHIPHASTFIPTGVREQFLLSDKDLKKEIELMTDWFTADIFTVPNGFSFDRVISQVSRLVTDVERISIDEEEPMSKVGMGVFYKNTSDGQPLRRELSAIEHKQLFDAYYRPHHQRLNDAVDRCLYKFGRCCIIDCHSFPKLALPYEDSGLSRPKICIGTDPFHTPLELAEAALKISRKYFDDVELNTPFSGSLVSSKHWGTNKNVYTLMVEIRRDLYLDSGTLKLDFTPVMSDFISDLVSVV